MNKGKRVTIDELASMVKVGFDVVGNELSALRTDVSAILLRMDNVSYRFELVDLEKRVYRLEHKAGISQK